MLLPQRVPGSQVKGGINLDFYWHYLEEFKEYRSPWYQQIADHYSGGILLEVDAGLAELGQQLLKLNPGLALVALEARPEFLKEAATYAARVGLGRYRWLRGNAAHLPFAPASCVGVVSMGGLRNWPDPGQVIAEMLRVTIPGGHIFLLDLRRDLDEFVAELMVRDWQSRGSPMTQWFLEYFLNSWSAAYTNEEVLEILVRAGVKSFRVDHDDAIMQMVHITI